MFWIYVLIHCAAYEMEYIDLFTLYQHLFEHLQSQYLLLQFQYLILILSPKESLN